MAVAGTMFSITDLEAFFASYVENPEAPDPTTFKPLANARVQLRSAAALVPLVVETDTAADGSFTLAPPNRPGLMTRLVVRRRVSILQAAAAPVPRPVLPTVEQLAYRSARVRLDRLDDQPLAIYTAAPDISATISQGRSTRSSRRWPPSWTPTTSPPRSSTAVSRCTAGAVRPPSICACASGRTRPRISTRSSTA
jgi:hypothetical protein